VKLARRLVPLLIVLGLAAGYGFLCIYEVKPDEQAVVLFLGRHTRTVGSGLHFRAFGLETVEIRRLTVEREEFGFRTVSAETKEYEGRPEERSMVCNDGNVVDVQFVVLYRIANLGEYLFRVANPEGAIRGAAMATMREVVSTQPVDGVLTGSRGPIESEARLRLQQVLDRYGTGVRIQSVELQEVQAPEAVRAAFRDVLAAEQDRERTILEAKGYRDALVPEARGDKEALINQARGYREQRILRAQGEADRFNQLLVEYRRAPEVTRDRLYIETIEEIFPSMEKVIIENGATENLLPYLPLGRKGVQR
jgi:membrane protease subunit HflK